MKKNNPLATILVISMGFLILYLLFSRQWLLFVSLLVGCTGVLSISASRMIERAWMKLAGLLSLIVPNIVLTIVYFCCLCPIAFFYRLTHKDSLLLSRNRDSFFINITTEVTQKSFEKMW